MKSFVVINFFLLICLIQSSVADTPIISKNKTPESPQPTSKKIPLYEDLIVKLKTQDSVIPFAPQTHPVRAMYNRESVIPAQCYTRNERAFNSCYVCHQASIPGRENVMNDDDLQAEYSFSDLGMTNHWKNHFEDRSDRVKDISDSDILKYISQDNYTELPARLKKAGFKGWIPELKNLHLGAGAFDEHGFAKDGSHWVAFNYKPFPSTFWPTNGSTDDVMIRLPKPFRQTKSGKNSLDVYRANLAILEANLKGAKEMTALPFDEKIIGKDLDGDGKLGITKKVTKVNAYVGGASESVIETHLYPQGTEFLHTVRYLGVGASGKITSSQRMKEVRYMKKWRGYPKRVYAREYQVEGYNKEAGNLPGYHNLQQYGLDNGSGWSLSGFIEDSKGKLRTYTYEENFSCMGCHGSIGSTIDKTFSFARKVDGADGWGYLDLIGMKDAPNIGESKGEIATYLHRVGGGSEFRHNEEMIKRFFKENGAVDEQKVKQAKDVYELITPSRKRALQLNKAYKVIVEDQDFIFGKDPTIIPPKNVFKHIDNKTATTLPPEHQHKWNIILDWSASEKTGS